MNGIRTLTHLASVALLLLWGGVMLYFYASGRIVQYLPPDGIFQPMVLIAGIGLCVLGLFNLLTLRQKEHACGHDHSHDHDGCCGHDHSHDDAHDHHHHEHAPDPTHTPTPTHTHSPKTSASCCGHDHSHNDAHDHHHHEHAPDPTHTHSPKTSASCCGHDHPHNDAHEHAHHEHTPAHHHDHSHGMIEESGFTGRLIAISILAIPITLAALNTPDQYSPAAITNKGLYNPNYADTSRADQFSLKKDRAGAPGATAPLAQPDLAATTSSTPDTPPGPLPAPAPGSTTPGATPSTTPAGSEPPPAATSGGSTAATPAEPQSYGSFTLADLEAQVPKSAAGNFILDVPEIYYTGGDIEVQSVLKGQSVETVAQVLPEKVNNDDGHRLRIFRMLVQCCAADARPYSIPVDFGKPAPDFKEMAWVKVVGTIDYKEEGGQTVPVMTVTGIEETTAPDQTMIY